MVRVREVRCLDVQDLHVSSLAREARVALSLAGKMHSVECNDKLISKYLPSIST